MAQHSAKHLIVGGGIIGCSIAYHLTRMGEKDVVLLERANLTEGATWHAAGLVGQLRSSRNTTRMLKKSVEMYDRLQNEEGMQFDWKKTGSLRLKQPPATGCLRPNGWPQWREASILRCPSSAPLKQKSSSP